MEAAFKVGEVVIVDHKESGSPCCTWVGSMDKLVGCEGVIKECFEREKAYAYLVKLSPVDTWWFPETALISANEAVDGYKSYLSLSELFSTDGNHDGL